MIIFILHVRWLREMLRNEVFLMPRGTGPSSFGLVSSLHAEFDIFSSSKTSFEEY